MELFASRYVAYSGLALILILAYTGYSVFGARTGMAWAMLATLLTTGNPLLLAGLRTFGDQELGPAMRIIHDESAGQSALPPVLARSDLTEADFHDWRAGSDPASYLYAAFVAYPVKNPLLPLPYRLTDPVKQHIGQLLHGSLSQQDKVIFITHDLSWISWVDEQFARAGFTNRWAKPNDYYVGVFERKANGGRQ